MLYYQNIWNEVESHLCEKLTTEPLKGEGRYMHGKLKTWKERTRKKFHGQDVLYDMYCNATVLLEVDPVYKQGENYHPQVYVEECKYIDAERQQGNMLGDLDDDYDDDDYDDGYFEA